jgi:hypothetical protein
VLQHHDRALANQIHLQSPQEVNPCSGP